MISIVVPVYNAEKYIATTIEMVQRQTYTDWELILVDDCSKDHSVDVMKSCIGANSDKIRLIQKEVNEGAAMARNTGIDAARGRYIAFLDADDIWYPGKLEKELAFLEKHDAAFVFSSYEFGDEDGVPTGKAVHVPKTLTYRQALSRTVIFTSTVLLDTQQTGKELIHMPKIGSEDTATWWKILKAGFTAYGLDESLAIYRRPPQSLSSNKGTAVKRIWNLYRTEAKMSVATAFIYMFFWAWRATVRRVVADTIRSHVESVKRFVTLELSLVGLIVQTLLFAHVWFQWYYPLISSFRFSQEGFAFGTGLKLYFRGHLLILAVYLVVLLFLSKIMGALKTGYLKPANIFASQMTALVITNIVIYFQLSLMRNWLIPGEIMAFLTVVQIVVAGIWSYLSNWIYLSVFPPIETLAIEGEESINSVVRAFDTRRDRFKIMRTLKLQDNNLEEIKEECLRWYGAVILGSMEESIRRELLEFCYSHYIRVYLSPDIPDILMQGTETMDLFDTPLLMCRNQGLSMEQRAAKRLLDIVVSGLGIIVSSPIMLIIAIAVKAYDGGPVFYLQDRLTYQGKEFRIRKFRSMCVDSEKNGARLASKHDSRITPVGHVLRNLHLDELPQLLNILKGDMTIVGPRPERVENVEAYSQEMPEWHFREEVKAGLTGYAQIYGKYNTSAYDKLRLDLMYIENYSLLLDIRLIFQTVRILLSKESTEGFEQQEERAAHRDELIHEMTRVPVAVTAEGAEYNEAMRYSKEN